MLSMNILLFKSIVSHKVIALGAAKSMALISVTERNLCVGDGRQVGVYLGCCGSETHALWLGDINNITGYEQTGCVMSMFANRLSFTYDFKGPSKAVDTGEMPYPACLPAHLASHM